MRLTQRTNQEYVLWPLVGQVPFLQLHYQWSVEQRRTQLSADKRCIVKLK